MSIILLWYFNTKWGKMDMYIYILFKKGFTMNSKVFKTLEYNKIIDKLESFAASSIGRELCHNLVPSTDLNEINTALENTNDALSRVLANGSVSFSGIHDIRPSIMRLDVQSTLSIIELLKISSLLDATARLKTYSRQMRNSAVFRDTSERDNIIDNSVSDEQSGMNSPYSDSLTSMFAALEPLTPLNSEIKKCIISEDEISDDASSTLRDIRRHMKVTNDKIHTELNRLVNSQTIRTYLQDYVITTRSGRYCLPVKAEHKSHFPGMVHDQSSTGSTMFIEPMSVVKLNNELRELELKEQAEIDIILENLSIQASAYCSELASDLSVLTTLDFIFAKAMLSRHYKCSCPVMNQNGYINIKKARHPLIDPHKVVPVDIYLGKDFDLLIITGPNTGGKTVSLKTVGLLTLMGQSGLNIPAFDNSELAVFTQVFADIGDEQSIEQSLSTFSSHMTNIVGILDKADSQSLVLFDEIGAGTDPTEGAALAISILSDLHSRGIRTMATTHYSEIKIYALTTDGVENASCEFDVESLRPTYRLLIGIPGKSNAFAISSKLGLPKYIIDDANSRINAQDIQFEDLLSDLEKNRITIEKEREEISRYKNQIENLKSEIQTKSEQLEARKDKIIRQANEKAAEILRDAKEYADETIRTLNKHGISMKELELERSNLRKKMDSTQNKLALRKKESAPVKQHKPAEFTLGVKVKVLSMNLTGTVSSRPNAKGDLFVQMGILRSQVNISDLEIIQEDAFGQKVSTSRAQSQSGSSGFGGAGKIKMSKSANISTEINLLGLTVDEAIAKLDKYLDDAYMSLPSVRVVHGKGTGALRQGITNYLKTLPYVKSFRLGEIGEGDTGVTIVEFK